VAVDLFEGVVHATIGGGRRDTKLGGDLAVGEAFQAESQTLRLKCRRPHVMYRCRSYADSDVRQVR
jgi:hypothetical protein